jgi:hypothetical protein
VRGLLQVLQVAHIAPAATPPQVNLRGRCHTSLWVRNIKVTKLITTLQTFCSNWQSWCLLLLQDAPAPAYTCSDTSATYTDDTTGCSISTTPPPSITPLPQLARPGQWLYLASPKSLLTGVCPLVPCALQAAPVPAAVPPPPISKIPSAAASAQAFPGNGGVGTPVAPPPPTQADDFQIMFCLSVLQVAPVPAAIPPPPMLTTQPAAASAQAFPPPSPTQQPQELPPQYLVSPRCKSPPGRLTQPLALPLPPLISLGQQGWIP